eukprot:scaffold14974_cov195-Amphora_coffeaeformis.AAC.55
MGREEEILGKILSHMRLALKILGSVWNWYGMVWYGTTGDDQSKSSDAVMIKEKRRSLHLSYVPKHWNRRWIGISSIVLLFFMISRRPFNFFSTEQHVVGAKMPPWKTGYLDIHHLRVGSSVSTFLVFPDGTTLLIDAGDKNYTNIHRIDPKVAALVQPTYPDDGKGVAEWILQYLRAASPHPDLLDYVLVTHFHSDHMGTVNAGPWPRSKSGNFEKTGITWIAEEMKINTLIDRNFPDYDFPIDLRQYNDDMRNYLRFVNEYKAKIDFEKFQVGSFEQIRAKYDPSKFHSCSKDASDRSLSHCVPFRVRNIKANLEFSPATPDNHHVFSIPDTHELLVNGKWNENKLSTAVVVEYGNFAYYNGADQEHRDFEGSPQIDTVTPVAMAAGKVHVATMNHHGYGTNDAYFDYLDPAVIVLPGWHIRHPPKVMAMVLARHATNRYFFATYTHARARADQDFRFDAHEGHIVVRVGSPILTNQGTRSTSWNTVQQSYEVFVLDKNRNVVSHFGPFAT